MKNILQCYFIYHKFHIKLPRTEPGIPQSGGSIEPSELRHTVSQKKKKLQISLVTLILLAAYSWTCTIGLYNTVRLPSSQKDIKLLHSCLIMFALQHYLYSQFTGNNIPFWNTAACVTITRVVFIFLKKHN
jgi:hypothetical protein